MMPLRRQLSAFLIVGLLAALAHYGTLLLLVEGLRWPPVPSTLLGFICGGIVSYVLNRRHTFASERPHEEAGWRFAVVSVIGFTLTWIIMHALVERLHAPYLPAQVLTTGIVMVWNFLANKLWTFGGGAPA
jgi:putative flippase GtrA